MDGKTKERVLADLEKWINRHPQPHEPALCLAGEVSLTPTQIVDAIRKETEDGRFIIGMIDFAIKRHSLEFVLASFTGATGGTLFRTTAR